MSEPERALFTGVFSVSRTQRRRFFWAAWWSAAPAASPFRRPDASSGGARSREEARANAERAAGQPLVEIAPRWAAAWARSLRGVPLWPKPRAGALDQAGNEGEGGEASASGAAHRAATTLGSRAWARRLLGVQVGATADEIRRAFRALALVAHPDTGGSDAAFIAAKRAHDVALAAARSPRPGRRRRRR